MKFIRTQRGDWVRTDQIAYALVDECAEGHAVYLYLTGIIDGFRENLMATEFLNSEEEAQTYLDCFMAELMRKKKE